MKKLATFSSRLAAPPFFSSSSTTEQLHYHCHFWNSWRLRTYSVLKGPTAEAAATVLCAGSPGKKLQVQSPHSVPALLEQKLPAWATSS